MKSGVVRPIAICVFERNGRILVAEGRDPHFGKKFYRPLGGTIEFGERSQDTIRRELREELGAAVGELHYLGTLENIFIYDGELGHEIVMVYDGRFIDETIYAEKILLGIEDSGVPFRASWQALSALAQPDTPPLYPDGLLIMLGAGPENA